MDRRPLTIFASHTSTDKEIVRRIAEDLESQGFEVWFDEWDILAGQPIADKIQKGIENSDAFLVFVSSTSLDSAWVKQELRAALHKRMKNEETPIIPLLLEDCKLPPFLQTYKYISFQDEEEYEASITDLFDALVLASDKHAQRFARKAEVGAIIRSASLFVDIIGRRGETGKFSESLQIVTLRDEDRITRRFRPDGEITSAEASPGRLVRTPIDSHEERWEIFPPEGFSAGQRQRLRVDYYLEGEFDTANRWFYTIDSPTRRLRAVFRFSEHLNIETFRIRRMRGETAVEEHHLEPQGSGEQQIFEFDRFRPPFRDRFEFIWS